jgi:hypothetical protein
MPKKPNYNFEKRQKELAREQKRETKRRERQERRQSDRAVPDGVSGAEPAMPGPVATPDPE